MLNETDMPATPETDADEAAAPAFLTLRLRRITWEAPGVLSLDFVSPDGAALPAFAPGAHVDLHLPGGDIRQYSLCGDPSDRATYRVGVREVEGGRVSRIIHRELRPGMLLKVGTPRNNFPLIASPHYLFVAGGIGVTPLLPMMREATRNGARWSLLFCTKRVEDAPFLDEALALGGEVSLHSSEAGTRLDVEARLADAPADTVLYCCGPEKLMTAVEQATAHWPEGTVRFEWFTARARPEGEVSEGFELVCAASGTTLFVPPEKSVLDVLNENGIDVPRSCEQGVCGTCECRIIEGEVDHRDSILSASEQAANQSMMTCVSRAKGSRLVLDV
ncbi:PDR/VanB family oxidoreductase [Roseomonas sp. NAR14]|uniref:PDR/VanB family oxidoreductase n=1 Tax=Roseomonas acroporae TaxID=2937791 RepID=A0A9X1Y7H2_9PROT|nr:PDR/VanB family oxidoreductase [Roseomonas acroporae]MCK8784538.1 PDR/VanB family oxidoreductase [Roseomonas acroporae]